MRAECHRTPLCLLTDRIGPVRKEERGTEILRSRRFQTLSSLSTGLIVAGILFPDYMVPLVSAGAALSLLAVWPFLPLFRETKLNFRKPSDRNALIAVGIVVILVILFAVWDAF
jgi:hypothetical protein